MTWPLSQDYNEAIQTPAAAFADPDLKRGEAVSNAFGIPTPYSGNFADVYQVRCPDGSRWAVKCFTREAAGLRERYQEISKHLRRVKLPFTVNFSYLDQGVRVAGKWYPVLKMQWVEGLTLNQFVGQYIDKPAMLDALFQIWGRMAHRLRAAEVGHCDLQHGNVLLVPGSGPNALALKLIDYDGMWVPALAGKKSGEVGHPCYQHPRRCKEGTYSIDVDRFPALLIATSLRALKARGKALWDRYDNGDNMLFKEADLREPERSPLFPELAAIPEAGAALLASRLRAALNAGLESVPLLDDVSAGFRAAPSKATKRKAVAAGPDPWDFGADEPAAATKVSRRVSRGGVPILAWVGGALALALFAACAGGAGVWAVLARARGPITPVNPVVQVTQPTPPAPKPPPEKDKEAPPKGDNDPKPQPIKPPPVPDDVPDKPGARVLFKCGAPHKGTVRAVCVSRDGKDGLSLGADNAIHRFNLQDGAEIVNYAVPPAEDPRGLALLPDGRSALIAGGDGEVRVFDLQKGSVTHHFVGHAGPVHWVDVSPDGKQALSCGDDGILYLWDLENNKEETHWPGSDKPISSARFGPDGLTAVSCGQDGVAHFWDVASRGETYRIEADAIPSKSRPLTAVLLPASRAYLGCGPAARYLWDLRLKRMVNGSGGGNGAVVAVAASPDGAVTADADAVASWFVLGGFPCGSGKVAPECLAFAPDGRHVLAGCQDGTVCYCVVRTAADVRSPAPTKAPAGPFVRFDAGWDPPLDPDGDCKFTNLTSARSGDKEALTIEVPGKPHDLDAARDRLNAPRLLRDVEGDFTAEVMVGGDFAPSATSTAPDRAPFLGAGLVAMASDQTYVRFERAAVNRNGTTGAFPLFEAWSEGKNAPLLSKNAAVPPFRNEPMRLRLERKGDRLTASASMDGEKWTELGAAGAGLPAKLKVGVAAISTSATAFKPRFEDFRLTGGAAAPAVAVKPPPEVKPPVVAAPKPDKTKPPAGDELAKVIKGVKEDFKADYDGLKTPADRLALSGKLRKEADAAADTPARRYALLAEARDLAAAGEDFTAAAQVIDDTAAVFAVDALEARTAALRAAGPPFSDKAASSAYLDAAASLLKDARAEDAYALVAPLLPAVEREAIEGGHDPSTVKADRELVKSLRDLGAAFDALRPTLQTLKDKPDDPDANTVAGKFYCFQKKDWDRGAPLLARGGDAPLAEAASRENPAPATPADQAAAGDGWAKAADAPTAGTLKAALQRRAYFWYARALPGLEDKDEEERVAHEVKKLSKSIPETQTAWEGLDVSAADPVGDCYVRMPVDRLIGVKQPVTGPVEITVVARAPHGGRLFFELQTNLPLLHAGILDANSSASAELLRPERPKPSWTTDLFPIARSADGWYTFAFQVKEASLLYSVDGKLLKTDARFTNDMTKRVVILKSMVRSNTDPAKSLLDVKSLTVKSLKPASGG